MRRVLYLIFGLLVGGLLAVALAGCDIDKSTPTADMRQSQRTEQALAEADSQIGMPALKNYQERKLMKMILELRDQEDLSTYAYIVNQMKGELVYIGRCIGYGLPYSVQYTSPEKLVDVEDYGINSYQANDSAVIPQADPNGLFMPDGLSATWLMLVDETTGGARPVYVEPEIIVSPFPLHNTTEEFKP